MLLAKEIIAAEFKKAEHYLIEELHSSVPMLDRITGYLIHTKGKQLRPVFLLLCARLGGALNDISYRAAAMVEIVHTASLIHDDIVDDSMTRRGAFSVNALWKSRAAVFAGDNLFIKAVLLPLINGDHKTLQIFSKAIEQTIAGELMQLGKTQKLNLREDVYYDIIRQKTATLLSAACEAGAASTFTDEQQIEKIGLFGEKVGMAFQIKDDLFDYGTADVGKPLGNDIKERKVTLPLIYTLNNCDGSTKRKLLQLIKQDQVTADDMNFLQKTVKEAGGFAYAEQKMLSYRQEALDILYEFPESSVRHALEELVMYTTERKY